ncbi:cell wall-binding repeat-containing protein [Herbiconiux sp. A18JL235]|uniref:Cell wall-binding repeat-containing protein n=1 Tax=Herbiconiux sp. A18JL235 TaxID=3152363 RepID=A0AB39BJ06_9MICO
MTRNSSPDTTRREPRPLSRRTIALLSVGLVTGALLATSALPTAHAAPPTPGTTQLVDVSSVPGVASTNNESYEAPSVSGDGRYVAFASSAQDLLAPYVADREVQPSLYIRDTATNTTKVAAPGASFPSISDDGMLVAFVRPFKVMVWSGITGLSTSVVKSVLHGGDYIDAGISAVDISGSGNAIVFSTPATDVMAGEAFEGARSRVYRVDASGDISLVGFDPMVEASEPAISGDGRYVAFTSTEQHTPLPANGHRQVYLFDSATGRIDLISTDATGTGPGNADSSDPAISADGSTVTFTSAADNLPGAPAAPGSYIFTRDRSAGTTTLTSSRGGVPEQGVDPAISGDGSVVAYRSVGCPPTTNACQVFVNDRTTGHFRVASSNRLPDSGDGLSHHPSVSANGQFVAWAGGATNLTPDSYPRGNLHWSSHYFLRNLGATGTAVRAAGADRYETAVKVSEGAFPEGAGTVYLAAGANYPDALSGAPAAGEAGGPVLLVEKDGVPASVQAEIDRLAPDRVVILGGTASVSVGVEAAVAAEGRTVERIGGADRYEVSAAVAADSFGTATTVYVASGEKAPDALSGAAAAGKDSPVLLTKKDELPASVRDEIIALDPEKIVILGGTDTVGETVALELGDIADTVRVSGADRYETSAAVADDAFVENTGGAVYIASGETFPDALTGSAAAIAAGAPVLLVQKDLIPIDIGEALDRLRPSAVYVLGGPDTVSDQIVDILGSYVYDLGD